MEFWDHLLLLRGTITLRREMLRQEKSLLGLLVSVCGGQGHRPFY